MKISIITTVYNGEKFIKQTIDSILSQQGDFELEYIITDGMSKDKTLEIIKSYGNKIKWISEKDSGQSDGINKGLRMATGDIVAFLNADDIYYPGTLQKVVEFFQANPEYKWVTGYCNIIDENSEEIRKSVTNYKNHRLDNHSYDSLLTECYISQPATFWRRELHDEFGYLNEDYHYCMDFDLWCRFGSKYPMGLIKEYLAGFRFYDTSKTGGSYEKQGQEHISITERYSNKKSVIYMVRVKNQLKVIGYKLLSFLNR